MNSIHGHEVMRMMVETGETYSREGLRRAIQERFGLEARFHTCSAENMDADALIDFLAARGKFIEEPAGFGMSPDHICDHE
ncbi:MAG TPA: DUF2492 family protein, partial [Caldithrix abyssi]|nr:DUF2492 family protein [Caldithrix abyssi]